MGMSTHVTGFQPPDELWVKMKRVWDACIDAGIDPPQEVDEFFNYVSPQGNPGKEVHIPSHDWRAEMSEGVEVNMSDIPKGVTVIRFWNSW